MLVLSLNMFGADACREARVATAAGGSARLFHLLLVGGESFLVPSISECVFIFLFFLFLLSFLATTRQCLLWLVLDSSHKVVAHETVEEVVVDCHCFSSWCGINFRRIFHVGLRF